MAETATIAPNVTNTLQAGGCETNPCFICWLHEKVEDAPETKGTSFSDTPLHFNLVGVRKETSLSDAFDDRMIVFFKVLAAEQQQAFEKAVEKELRASLESCLGKAPQTVKFIPCSKGLWVAAVFRISTDPGLVERRGDLESKKSKLQADVDAAKGKLEALDKERMVSDERLPKAQEELKAAKEAAAKKKLWKEVGSLEARKKAIPREQQGLEEKVKKLEDQKAKMEAELKAHDESLEEFEISEGNEGWYEEGRALIPPGHYANKYSFFIHKISSAKVFAKDTSLAALTVGYLDGMRIYSVDHVCQNVKDFQGLVVRQVKKASGEELRFSDGSITLELKKSDQGQMEAFYKQGTTSTKLAAGDRVLLKKSVGGTNIHRAHNAKLQEDGTLSGSGSAEGKVADWSEGCQVFPLFNEFNLFLRLCAISKRWRCAAKNKQAGGDDCVRLAGGTGDELGPGEKALIARFGEEFVHSAADLHKDNSARAAKVNPEIRKRTERKQSFTWTEADEKTLSELLKAKADTEKAKDKVDKATLGKIKTQQDKKARRWTDKEEDELQKLIAERDGWRRKYLREKVLKLRADFMRNCDMSGKCSEFFSYTLLQCSASEMVDLQNAWDEKRNTAWDKKLVIGAAK
ncbi:hypothetical protein [Cystobacter ferrugineus]|uniref:Uncharacterized protein n=1 Tax=Cystobacter ferrugineus TaxID=83449 RepID=A0A1L9BJB7_9BACT|nr:hypothetical protein [Cystobacter ferrugineus]OJH42347.1 hypothetical protein BON30_03850 [Cystobacter ferrugineus]